MSRSLCCLMILGVCSLVPLDSHPSPFANLQGKIFTSNQEIQIPECTSNVIKTLRGQDKNIIVQNENGSWDIYFVAFFRRPLPVNHLGVVVLDAAGNPSMVAEFKLARGQTNLAAHLVVDRTDTPAKKHMVRMYYVKGKKPIDLARKAIVLK